MYTHGHDNTSGGDWGANPNYTDTNVTPSVTSAYLRTGNGRSQGFMLNQAIDLTPYRRIFIRWKFNCSSSASSVGNALYLYGGDLIPPTDVSFGNGTYFIASSSSNNFRDVESQALYDIDGALQHKNSTYQIHEFDISSITGSWFIDMYQNASTTAKPSAESYCNQLWLE